MSRIHVHLLHRAAALPHYVRMLRRMSACTMPSRCTRMRVPILQPTDASGARVRTSHSGILSSSSRPLLVHGKGRMLHSRCFPEHCRTPPGNSPRPRATALTKAFPVVALSAAMCPSPVREIGGGVAPGTVHYRDKENHHDYRSLGFVP